MGFKEMVATLADFTRHGLTGSMAGEALQESLHGVLEMQQKLGIPMVRNAKGASPDAVAGKRPAALHRLVRFYEAVPPQVLEQIQDVWHLGHARVPARPGRS